MKVYTWGSEGDEWFYTMELVKGAPLASVCERLQADSPDLATVDVKAWWLALSTACSEERRAEKPLSDPEPTRPLLPRGRGERRGVG